MADRRSDSFAAAPASRNGAAQTAVPALDMAAVLTLVCLLPLISIYASRGVQTVLAAAALLAAASALWAGGMPALRQRLARALDERRLPAWSYFFTAVMVWGALSALWSVDPGHSLDRALKIVLTSTIATGVYLLLPRLEWPSLGLAGAASVAVASVILIVELTGDGLLLEYVHDGDPHMMNRATVIVSLLMWPVLALLGGPRAGLLRGGLVAIVAAAAVVSESETAVLALVVGLGVAALAACRPGIVVAAGMAGSAVAFFGMPVLARILRESLPVEWLGPLAVRASVDLRLDIWNASAEAILHRPVLGWGLESSRLFGLVDLSALAPGFAWTMPPMHHPHNGMLQAWLELGVVGAAMLFALTCGALLAARRRGPAVKPYAFGCIAAVLSTSAVSHGLWQTWWLALVMLLAVLFALTKRG